MSRYTDLNEAVGEWGAAMRRHPKGSPFLGVVDISDDGAIVWAVGVDFSAVLWAALADACMEYAMERLPAGEIELMKCLQAARVALDFEELSGKRADA